MDFFYLFNLILQLTIINLFDILKKGDMGKNVTLRDGDVVFLSGNGKVNFAADVLPWISATYQVKRMND